MAEETRTRARQLLDDPRALLVAIGIAVVFRGFHLTGISDSPLFHELQWDAKDYDRWAADIANGIARGGAFWLDPLYAYLLGGLYKVFGQHLLIPRLLGAACGVATAWLVSRTARRIWDSRIAELSAAATFALYLPALHYEAIVGKTALATLLVAAAVELLFAGTDVFILASGVTLGFLALTRGNLVLLLPLFALLLLFGWDRPETGEPPVSSPSSNRLERLVERVKADVRNRARQQRVLMLVAAALPVIGFATIHNWFASGEFVPTTTNYGINLYLGNHAGNVDGSYTPPDFLPAGNQSELASFRDEAERRTGNRLRDEKLSGYWADQAWAEIRANPGTTALRMFHKLELLTHDDEIADSDAIELAKSFLPALRLPLISWGLLLPLAVLGAAIGWKRRRVRCLVAIGAVCLASLLPFFILGRLRAPVAPVLIILAAGVPEWAWARYDERRWSDLRWPAALFVASSLFVCFFRPSWMATRYKRMLAVNWYNFGLSLTANNRQSDARLAFERAVATDDKSVPAALRALAQIHEQRGDLFEAERVLERLVELRPDSPSAVASLRRMKDLRASGGKGAAVAAPRKAGAPEPARVQAGSPSSTWRLSPEARATFVAELSKAAPETAAWISFDGRDPGAKDMANDLSAALEAAHWSVRAIQPERISLKAGLYLFSAGEPTAGYTALLDALKGAGYDVRNGTGYAEYVVERRKENPNFQSLYFADRQEYVLAVGRKP